MLARDADMFTCLEGRSDGLGFVGTDVWNELAFDRKQKFPFLQVAEASNVRLALLTTEEKVAPFQRKLARAEPLLIATTYPAGARAAITGLGQQVAGRYIPVETMDINGSIEGAPTIFPQVDAVYDIVESGRTAEENGVQIVYDDLAPVALGAVVREGEI
jgi:ATP phosphoribosyltransferase